MGGGKHRTKATVRGHQWADACRESDLAVRLRGIVASQISAPGMKDSKVVQPFTALQLPMEWPCDRGDQPVPVETINDALEAFAEFESVDSYRVNDRVVNARKSSKLACIPEVGILLAWIWELPGCFVD